VDIGTQPWRLTILGAGPTGVGVARVAVGRGIPVVLVDPGRRVRARARTAIGDAVGARTARLLLGVTGSVADGPDATMMVEAVTESAVAKTRAFAQACAVIAPGTPLASCSSAIPIEELADWSGRPCDVVGTHFPTPACDGVEVTRGRRTSEQAVDAARRLVQALGLRPVVLGEQPGFVGARLQYPLINAAAGLVGRGTRAASVDAVMGRCYGHAVGPLRAADLIGIDTLVVTLDELYTRTGDESCRPSPVLLDMLQDGALGRKAGRGFYQYC
jgi:methoxymalonate biosynthesis protein